MNKLKKKFKEKKMTTTMVVDGIHPGNYDIVPDIVKFINRPKGWEFLTTILVAKENENCTVTLKTISGYIDQGLYIILDFLNEVVSGFENIGNVCFHSFYENGSQRKNLDEHVFNFIENPQGDPDINVIVDIERNANFEEQKLILTVIILRRNPDTREFNKRTLTVTNY